MPTSVYTCRCLHKYNITLRLDEYEKLLLPVCKNDAFQTVAVLLLLSPCIHPVTHEETVILEDNVV